MISQDKGCCNFLLFFLWVYHRLQYFCS